MSGGVGRMYAVCVRIAEVVGSSPIVSTINPGRAVTYGAAFFTPKVLCQISANAGPARVVG